MIGSVRAFAPPSGCFPPPPPKASRFPNRHNFLSARTLAAPCRGFSTSDAFWRAERATGENVFLSAFIADGYIEHRGISVAPRALAGTAKRVDAMSRPGLITGREGTVAKEDRGFASMDRHKQRDIASKGGKAAHQKGTAHEWTSEEAREAGRKGGMASHRRKQEQQLSDESSSEAPVGGDMIGSELG